jgi:uncharacterized delta-60 repeat protein
VRALAALPDGGVLLGGYFTKVGAVERNYLARLKADGTLDVAFDAKIGAGKNYFVYALTVQPDGKLVIGGRFSSVQGQGRDDIARLNPDGTVDRTFRPMSGTGPADNYVVYVVVLQPDQRLLIGGRFSSVNAVNRSNIARLHK